MNEYLFFFQAYHHRLVKAADEADFDPGDADVNDDADEEEEHLPYDMLNEVEPAEDDEQFDILPPGKPVKGYASLERRTGSQDHHDTIIDNLAKQCTVDEFKQAVERALSEPTGPAEKRTQEADSNALRASHDVCDAVVVEYISEACADLTPVYASMLSASKPEVSVLPRDRPSIGSVSRLFGLNKEQHRAFVLLASSLLKGVINNMSLTEDKERLIEAAKYVIRRVMPQTDSASLPQLRAHMSGPAGTGKTTVLQALLEFARRWYLEEALLLTATTGIAGTLIRGCTVHSGLGIRIAPDQEGNFVSKPTNERREKFSRVTLMVVDEVSMLGGQGVYSIDRALRGLKLPGQDFGGVDIVFVGDFAQLDSVAGNVYEKFTPAQIATKAKERAQRRSAAKKRKANKKMSEDKKMSTDTDSETKLDTGETDKKDEAGQRALNSFEDMHNAGVDLWHNLNAYVALVTPVRQASDPEYAELLGYMRFNTPNLKSLKLANTRVISPTLQPPLHAKVAVPENNPREKLNLLGFNAYVKARFCKLSEQEKKNMPQVSWRKIGALRIIAEVKEVLDRVEQPKASSELKKSVFSLTEANRNHLPAHLNVVIGQDINVTHNVDVPRGIANGTSAVLVDVYVDDNCVRWSKTAQCHCAKASDVQGLLLKHHRLPYAEEAHYPPLPPGCFPLQVLDKRRNAINCEKPVVKVQKGTDKNGNTVERLKKQMVKTRVRIYQFPAVSVFSLTGHKTQGTTTDALIVGPPGEKYRLGQGGWLYVVLSRVRSLSGLYLMEPLCEDLKKYIPRKAVIKELERLQLNLGMKTAESLDSIISEVAKSKQQISKSAATEEVVSTVSSRPASSAASASPSAELMTSSATTAHSSMQNHSEVTSASPRPPFAVSPAISASPSAEVKRLVVSTVSSRPASSAASASPSSSATTAHSSMQIHSEVTSASPRPPFDVSSAISASPSAEVKRSPALIPRSSMDMGSDATSRANIRKAPSSWREDPLQPAEKKIRSEKQTMQKDCYGPTCIRNDGAECHINSILQALVRLPAIAVVLKRANGAIAPLMHELTAGEEEVIDTVALRIELNDLVRRRGTYNSVVLSLFTDLLPADVVRAAAPADATCLSLQASSPIQPLSSDKTASSKQTGLIHT